MMIYCEKHDETRDGDYNLYCLKCEQEAAEHEEQVAQPEEESRAVASRLH